MSVSLIGLSVVGKSRVGHLLLKKLNYGFIDFDRTIEKVNHYKLQDIIDCLCDEAFLELEENAKLSIRKVMSFGYFFGWQR
jgi:shikimate kinase